MMPENNGELCSVIPIDGGGVNNSFETLGSAATSPVDSTKCGTASCVGGVQKNGLALPKAKNFKAGFKINQLADMLAKRSLKMAEGSDGETNGFPGNASSAVGQPPTTPPTGPSADAGGPPSSPEASALKIDSSPPPLTLPDESSVPSDDSSPPVLGSPSDPPPSLQPVTPPDLPTTSCTAESIKTELSTDELTKTADGASDSPPPPVLSPAPEQMPPLLEPQVPPPIPTALSHLENSTKPHAVRTRSSPRSRKSLVETELPARKGVRKSTRRSKQLVETSTQTAAIPLISEESAAEVVLALPCADIPLEPPILKPAVPVTPPTYICLFCQLTFVEKTDCLNHEATHTLKRKTKFIKCQFCMKKLPNLEDFKSHCVKHHSSDFYLCSECDLRFYNEQSLDHHSKNFHNTVERTHFNIFNKKVKTSGTNLDIDVNCEVAKRASVSPRCSQKVSPKEKTEDQLYEAEMLFYSHLSGNIQDNLSNHLDGKIGRSESGSDIADSSKTCGGLLAVVASSSGTPGVPPSRAPSPYRTRSKTPNPLPTSAKKFKKLPNWQQKFWEKYNFPSNYRYEHRFGDKNYVGLEKSPMYLKDLSCLDIKTQLTMRENVKKLEGVTEQEKNTSPDSFPYIVGLMPVPSVPVPSEVSAPVVEVIKVPKKKSRDAKASRRPRFVGENNVPQVVTRAQSMDATKQRKGSVDGGVDGKMTLRRQPSAELAEAKTPEEPVASTSKTVEEPVTTFVGKSVVSGEWVRPRSYLCGACCAKFSSLWDLEDHKWAVHPNVWCTHYEFEVDKLERVFHLEEEQEKVAKITLPDLYRRYLSPKGSLSVEENLQSITFPHSCTKCRKLCQNQPELHRHILDCGGDTTWSQTMCSSPATMKRRWRPYGSRRRKTTAQRGVKRTITSTPPLRNYISQPKIRTKPGDVESIQKMLANLPEKRTRRAINFDEVSTRSQTTIQNNRLLRKREVQLHGKVLTTIRQRNRTGAVVRTDSPRRRFKLKEVTVDVTPLPAVAVAAVAPSSGESSSQALLTVSSDAIKKTKKVLSAKTAVTVEESSLAMKSKNKKKKQKIPQPKPIEVQKDGKADPADVLAQISLKKRIVQRKTHLVRTIKKRLTNSQKIMEKRRRSDRIKNIPKEEDDFTTEEQLPIAKLKEAKQNEVETRKNLEIVVAASETAQTPSIEQPTDSVKVPEPIVIKVVRPKLKRKRKKVTLKVVKKSPLKIEVGSEEPTEISKTEEVQELPIPQSEPVEPKEPEPLIPAEKVTIVKKVVSKRGKRRTRWSKKRPLKKAVALENTEASRDVTDSLAEETPELLSEAIPETVVTETVKEVPEQVPISLEKIIPDKLNENLVKRKGNRRHEKPKNNKRLRMTVTLKEATLKVLDKPLAAPGPNKWTPVNPVDGIINFEPSLTPAQATPLCSQSDVPLADKEVLDRGLKSPQLSKPQEVLDPGRNSPQISKQEVVDVLENGVVDDLGSSPLEVSGEYPKEVNEPPIIFQEEKAVEPVSVVPDSKSGHEIAVNEVVFSAPGPCKRSSDVSTTVPSLDETVKEMDPPVVSSMSADSCSPSLVINVPEVKSMMPIFTIEEATSSEDVSKPTSSKSSAPKIAEADSTGEKIDNISCSDNSNYEGKSEPEMVVSSTNPVCSPRKRKKRASVVDFDCKDEVPSSTLLIPEELDRRSRRKSKEVPSSNEFKIDDPLLLVDELWSDLDSDSDSKKKRVRRVKKKTPRKKTAPSKEVDLEALLRNFGEKKEPSDPPILTISAVQRRRENELTSRQRAERKAIVHPSAYTRVSLKFFSFNKKVLRHGRYGEKLLTVKKTLKLPMLPLLPSVITENPEQVIVCRSKRVRKKKADAKVIPKVEVKHTHDLRVSLPLELLGDLTLLNNNHLRSTDPMPSPPKQEMVSPSSSVPEVKPAENRPKRPDCIDKIFSCEICKTYYYSSCQLRAHKQSNRHKQNERESLAESDQTPSSLSVEPPVIAVEEACDGTKEMDCYSEACDVLPVNGEELQPLSALVPLYEDKNDDSSEMPVLEGPFLETRPVEPVALLPVAVAEHVPPPAAPTPSVFGFSEESLKDIQKAIGCTDEEMLILTLLGENTAPEPDILDLSNCTPKAQKSPKAVEPDAPEPNGAMKVDLKQRMTSALASLVNRAVQNLFTKTETVSKMAEKSDAMTFLNKLAMFSNRRKAIVGDLSSGIATSSKETKQVNDKEDEKYEFKCNICGNRFEKESTRDFHIARSHHKRKNRLDDEQMEDWLQWDQPDETDAPPSSQFWCSDCGINFLSPQEVLEHQKAEHSTASQDEGGKKSARGVSLRRCSELDAEEKRILANQALQKLAARRCDRKSWGRKLYSTKKPTATTVAIPNVQKCPQDIEKMLDVYDFNEFDSDPEPVALTHVKKAGAVKERSTRVSLDEDDEDNIPLAAVKKPGVEVEPVSEEEAGSPEPKVDESKNDSFKISLQSKLLVLSKGPSKASSSGSEDDSLPLMMMSKKESSVKSPNSSDGRIDDDIGENVIYQHNDSVSSFESFQEPTGGFSDSDSESGTEPRKSKRVVPSLTATLTDASNKKPSSPRGSVVSRVWNNPGNYYEEVESDIDKEMIMKKVWKKKREVEKSEDEPSLCESVKIKKTEISDEVVIKCGPREKSHSRRKSSEPPKTAIVRKIWSGKCGFQTKAALKTYESDIIPEPMPLTESSPSNTPSPPPIVSPPKRRSRVPSTVATKKRKVSNASDDDLDSLLEEIEQENVEKAIRSEFLHLRRSEKSQIEPPVEPPGLFSETPKEEKVEKKRKGGKNSRLVRKRGGAELKKHKKHRHRHHHHKHKHKKSRNHEGTVARHRSKHRGEDVPVRVLERMCEGIASRSDSCPEPSHPGTNTYIQPRISTDLDNLDSKLDEILSPLIPGGNAHVASDED